MGSRIALNVLALFVASVPLDVFPVAGAGSVSVVLSFALVPVGVLAIVRRGFVKGIGGPELAILVFCVWAGLSSTWAMDSDASLQRVLTYAQLLVFAFFTRQLVESDDDAFT